MSGEATPRQEFRLSGLAKNRLARAAGVLVGLMAFVPETRAEGLDASPFRATIETIAPETPEAPVEGKEAVLDRAEACKKAYDDAKLLRENARDARPIFLVVDTFVGGGKIADHVRLAKEGAGALRTCFQDEERLPQVVNVFSPAQTLGKNGVDMKPLTEAFFRNSSRRPKRRQRKARNISRKRLPSTSRKKILPSRESRTLPPEQVRGTLRALIPYPLDTPWKGGRTAEAPSCSTDRSGLASRTVTVF